MCKIFVSLFVYLRRVDPYVVLYTLYNLPLKDNMVTFTKKFRLLNLYDY